MGLVTPPRAARKSRIAAAVILVAVLGALATRSAGAQESIPEWCAQLPRPEYADLERVASADDWFEVYAVRAGVFAIYEPHQFQEVISYLILGEERALLFDTGMGIGSIRAVVDALTELPVTVLNSHTHPDHTGGNALFGDVLGRDSEFTRASSGGAPNRVMRSEIVPEALCRPLPEGVSVRTYRVAPFRIHRTVEDGEAIDLGGRRLEVLAIPGHTPDSVALLDREHGLLFTGDTFYAGPIYLFSPETNIADYADSVGRLAALVPDLQLLLPGHNLPVAEPSLLLDLERAVAAVRSGEIQGELSGDRLQYAFDGFLLVVSRARQ